MNFDQALRAVVSIPSVARELRKHGASLEEFQKEFGIKPYYKGADVLGFLGY